MPLKIKISNRYVKEKRTWIFQAGPSGSKPPGTLTGITLPPVLKGLNLKCRGKSSCQRLIVTDGLRYEIYLRDKDGKFSLFAYMNLTRLRHDYPAYKCEGAKEALLAMAPEWESREALI